jgi:hypothetical protein
MAVDHVKSTPITNLDASPVVQVTAGEGGAAPLCSISSGDVIGIASSFIDATYQFVRIPSNCKVKQIIFDSQAQTTSGTIDIGLYYATDGEGNKPVALLAAAAIDQDFFAAAVSVIAASGPTDVTNQSTTYTPAKRNQPIWQAVGLSADPGGFFDIVGTLKTALTTGTGKMGLTCNFTI